MVPDCRLENLNRKGGHPDIDLTEPGLELFFEIEEELPAFMSIRGIHEDSYQFIAVRFSFVVPYAPNHQGFGGNRAEVIF